MCNLTCSGGGFNNRTLYGMIAFDEIGIVNYYDSYIAISYSKNSTETGIV